MVGGLASHLLRRHVSGGAHHHAGLGRDLHRRRVAAIGRSSLGTRQLGQAEIQNLDPIVGRDEKILRLQIAVHDAFFVRCRKTARRL
jgi:hypothetical protein